MMGTTGDMLPLLWTCAGLVHDKGMTTHLAVQPFQLDTVLIKLGRSKLFSKAWETTEKVQEEVSQVVFTPPVGAPPKIEVLDDVIVEVLVEVRHCVFQHQNGAALHIWVPLDEAFDEWRYQEMADPRNLHCKKSTYGIFLTRWRGLLSFLAERMPGAFCLSNHYDQETSLPLFESAIGLQSDIVLRIGTLGLMDRNPEGKLYAMSEALCPRTLHLSPSLTKEISPESWKLEGVIAEPRDLFPASPLPEAVEYFLQEPTIVVSLGHLGFKIQDLLAGHRSLFVNSTLDTALPGHLHWPGLLNLEAAFSRCSLVVHSCGVGTIHQVACAGKPSIGVSITKEKLNNGKRLEDKQVAVHFPLFQLTTDVELRNEFERALSLFTADPDRLFPPDKLKETQDQALGQADGMQNCVDKVAKQIEKLAEAHPYPSLLCKDRIEKTRSVEFHICIPSDEALDAQDLETLQQKLSRTSSRGTFNTWRQNFFSPLERYGCGSCCFEGLAILRTELLVGMHALQASLPR